MNCSSLLRRNFSAVPVAIIFFLFILSGCGPEPHADFRVVPEHLTVTSMQGAKEHLLFRVEIPGGSYIYGNPKGPGTGKATEVRARSTPHLHFLTPGFRPPEKHYAAGEKDHVWIYRHETEILLPLNIHKGTPPGTYKTSVTVHALVCSSETCIPVEATVPVSVRIVRSDEYRKNGTADRSGEFIFPSRSPEGKEIPPGVQMPEPAEPVPVFAPVYITRGSVAGVIQGILFGLLAGFFLNFMPCVLPVVSLKIMGLVKHARGDRKSLVTLGVFFSAGIMISFAALALLAAFLGYNWGELFQKRTFLIAMTGLVFVLALSMFEIFTFPVPAFAGRLSREQRNLYVDSFVKGLLATLLATPCSGPFLGGTLAWALTRPPGIIFLIFMSVGAGMALPYMVLSAFPGMLRFIPRPGEWTVTFERIMGFLMLGTVVYLVGLLEPGMIVPTLWFLMFIGIGFWQFGRYGSPVRPARTRVVAGAVLALFIVGGYWISYRAFDRTVSISGIREDAFSMEALYRNRDEGVVSAVKFTADWCPNCTLVEARVLRGTEVISLMKTTGTRLYTADLTRENPQALRLLHALGGRSIPFLAVFPAGSGFYRPYCLRDIYTRREVLSALKRAAGFSPGDENKK